MKLIYPSGARPTNTISIEFEIRSKFGVLYYGIYLTDHNEILHTSRQYDCRDVSKISMWSMEYSLNQSTGNFGRILNYIEISVVGQAPGICFRHPNTNKKTRSDSLQSSLGYQSLLINATRMRILITAPHPLLFL